MIDMKEFIPDKAEELAYERYNKGFYELTEEQQKEIWKLAEEAWIDYLANIVDSAIERRREECLTGGGLFTQ